MMPNVVDGFINEGVQFDLRNLLQFCGGFIDPFLKLPS